MKLKQIVVSIENATGRLFEVTNALGAAVGTSDTNSRNCPKNSNGNADSRLR